MDGEIVEEVAPVETDWSDAPFPPTMIDEEAAEDPFLQNFDENGNYMIHDLIGSGSLIWVCD